MTDRHPTTPEEDPTVPTGGGDTDRANGRTAPPAPAPSASSSSPADAGIDDELPDEFFGPTSYGDALEDQRLREDYKRGRLYEVYVPSIFERARPGSDPEPVLAKRVFAGWEDRDGERHPLFVTDREWQEVRLKEEMDALRAEGYRGPEQWMTLQEIASEVGKSVRTIRRHIIERGECPYTEFGRDKKVRRSDFEEWLAKDRPETREIRETEQYRREDF